MKILHTADWHLDAPMQGYDRQLRKNLARIPERIGEVCKQESCDLVLIAGDVFDGVYSAASYRTVYEVLKNMAVPVFIAPGNHDYCDAQSAWVKEIWPENVHIFKTSRIESVSVPGLNCRVYGAGFESMDCPALLNGFKADCDEKYAIGLFHGDPAAARSNYNPITAGQVQDSGLDYLALGHIHKADRFTAGKTLCAWPGCPMGKGYDEPGQKGVYIVELDETAFVRFYPLKGIAFYDLETPIEKLDSLLPPMGNENYYRITLTGACDAPDLPALQEKYARFPNLILRDKTTREVDIWGALGEDNFEGVYFGLLKQAMENATEEEKQEILLAARISRQLLEGQEVVLP